MLALVFWFQVKSFQSTYSSKKGSEERGRKVSFIKSTRLYLATMIGRRTAVSCGLAFLSIGGWARDLRE